MPHTESSATFRNKISPFATTCELHISVFLVLPEENGAHRLFLENVCRAITKAFAPASVVLYQEKLFHACQDKIFLAPLPLLQKKFPHLLPHQIFKAETFTVIPLESLDRYAHDVHCKRMLWNTIQHLFQS